MMITTIPVLWRSPVSPQPNYACWRTLSRKKTACLQWLDFRWMLYPWWSCNDRATTHNIYSQVTSKNQLYRVTLLWCKYQKVIHKAEEIAFGWLMKVRICDRFSTSISNPIWQFCNCYNFLANSQKREKCWSKKKKKTQITFDGHNPLRPWTQSYLWRLLRFKGYFIASPHPCGGPGHGHPASWWWVYIDHRLSSTFSCFF